MKNAIRIGLTVFLLLAALGLFYLQYKEPAKRKIREEKRTDWSFKLKKGKITPFICKANKIYFIYSTSGLKSLSANGVKQDLRFYPVGGKGFSISFERDTEINMGSNYLGKYKKNILYIKEIQENILPRVIYLEKKKYTKKLFGVSKGMNFDIKIYQKGKSFYLGMFKGETEVDSVLRTPEYFFSRANRGKSIHSFNFWDSYNIRLKAAEDPIFLVITKGPYTEPLIVELYHPFDYEPVSKKSYKNAYYLSPGDIIDTPFWLDKGDEIRIYISGDEDKIKCSIDGKVWTKAVIHDWKRWHAYYPKENGYLKIKAIKGCLINKVWIRHNKKWELVLKEGETKKIQVFKGDILKSRAMKPYYINGKLLDKFKKIHEVNEDGFMEFKRYIDPQGENRFNLKYAVDPRTIKVWVYSRRHY